ncbi:MAG: hypothetical protein KatS3mg068_0119 [Candidatus Sericytochromatia bacterium]|nr:MAG: hypothetical protein KatS3mg068_0119 [Candidatus Sericytochromatia bacterium]
MSNNKDLTIQSYEKKIVNTLREEKYELQSWSKNKEFLNSLDIQPTSLINISNKFYRDRIIKLYDSYCNEFSEIILPIIAEKGLTFDVPEEQVRTCMEKYDIKISKILEKIQISNKLQSENFYDKNLISSSWGICLDGIENVPFIISLGSNKVIVLDNTFNLDITFFALIGAIPDIQPITHVGNIELPPNTYRINLQLMVGTEFKQVSLIVLKQKLENIENFLSMISNIGLVVDTKISLEEDLSGLKWIKNSLQYSLFKNKNFLNIAKAIKIGGIVIDKSVSPMQVQKIQTVMKISANLNIGFEINKLGTIQYSILVKKENVPLAYDAFDRVICKIPNVISNKVSAM